MTNHFVWSGAIKKNCVVFEEVPRIPGTFGTEPNIDQQRAK